MPHCISCGFPVTLIFCPKCGRSQANLPGLSQPGTPQPQPQPQVKLEAIDLSKIIITDIPPFNLKVSCLPDIDQPHFRAYIHLRQELYRWNTPPDLTPGMVV